VAAAPITQSPATHCARLAPFRREHAERIASWVRSPQEAFWLSPRSRPPVTPASVRSWAGRRREQFVLLRGSGDPIAYGEVNVLNLWQRSFWLGHLIVDGACRGQGVGRELTAALLRHAFEQRHAVLVALVVFPENETAVACYQAAGLRAVGYETHYFASIGRSARLLRMEAAP
jgi:RimJ/RimL family protein N-acetyltransferase